MNWYLAKIVYRIICGDGGHTPQFDEQLRLVLASDELHAFQKARRLGEKEQDNFLNDHQKPVHWKFVDVTELHQLDELIDGAEIYSLICEKEDSEAYVKLVNDRSKYLHERCFQKTFQMN